MANNLRLFRIKKTTLQVMPVITVLILLGWLVLSPLSTTHAAAILTVTPITWNVVGIDGDDVNTGPNVFPVGARVCNTGDQAATNLLATFRWDQDDPTWSKAYPNVDLSGPASQTRSGLDTGACADFYFNVAVARDPDVYFTTRGYHIEVVADGLSPVTTPAGREIWVESLELETNINAGTISGDNDVAVGQEVQYVVQGASTPNYEQLVHFINFPSNILRLKSVSAAYGTPAGATNDKTYADACGWINDPAVTDYLSCTGTGIYTGTTTVGGSLVTTYTVDIISSGVVTLTHLIHGYQDNDLSFNYNLSPGLVITATNQITPTETTTPTLTPTGTITPTTTITGTVTPTVTGTPPTPTATGTITPNIAVTNAVSPSEARVGQNFTFTVRVSNNGAAPAANVNVTDSFSSFLDITSATTTQGTASTNTATRTVTVAMGTLNPGESETITIVARVNNTVTTNTNVNNSAVVVYSISGINQSLTSNTVTFRVLASSTLPGTGGMEIEPPQAPGGQFFWPALLAGGLLGLLSLLAFGLSLWARTNQPLWAGWYAKTGAILITAGLFFSLVAWGLRRDDNGVNQLALLVGTPQPTQVENGLPLIPTEEAPWPLYPTQADLETLPDYPIPTPSLEPTQEGEAPPDASPVERILIPALNVDTVVKYVPYDGFTWLIAGLRDEVAWLGETSWPGLGGNTALAGHVSLTNGGDGPFRNLPDLAPGDEVYLYTQENVYTYIMRDQRVVEEMELSVVSSTDRSQLTLITCSGWNAELKIYLSRVVVFADLARTRPLTNEVMGN